MKKRYLIGHRLGAVLAPSVETTVESFLAGAGGVETIRKLSTGHRLVEMDEEVARQLSEQHPDLLIEEDPELELFPMPELPPRVPVDADIPLDVEVTEATTNRPIADVSIYAVGTEVTYKGVTGADGMATVSVREPDLQRIIASPRRNYWSRVTGATTVTAGRAIKFALQPLPVDGSYGWGPLALGVDKVASQFTGRGTRVAVIDSGIAPHEDVNPRGGRNTLDGQDPAAWNVDTEGHGTHCAGIVAALQNDVGIRGIAPDAEVYSLKVFPGGRFSDLIEAINWAIDNYIDVVSLSLGSANYSRNLELAIDEGVQRGIVFVAAAGNESGAVAYPAAFDNVIAVSAIGKTASFAADSAHALRVGSHQSTDGEYFAASFTNYGDKVEVCAPGVAILSSVPGGYAAWDGTSMACPMVTGLVALILEAYPDFRTGDAWASYQVRTLLRDSATDLGLPPEIQGAGLPNVESALSSALDSAAAYEQQVTTYRSYLEGMLDRTRQVTKSLEDALDSLAHP